MAKLSNHFTEDRLERMMFIAKEIEWGEIILTAPTSHDNRVQKITSTGVVLICNPVDDTIITAYLLTMTRAYAIYRALGYEHIPDWLLGRIRKNLKKCKKHNFFL